MARWEPGARERLEQAALELFGEQGFADTTVPQIAARAGLTTRTFFRHFADKREVLFAGEDDVPQLVAGYLAQAPADETPMQLIARGLPVMATRLFDGRRDQLQNRHRVVAQDDGLRERDLHKRAALSDQIRAAFQARGVDPLTSTLTAELAVTVMHTSLTRWLARNDDRALADIVTDTLTALRTLASDV
ncbi:Transcription regulator, TetR family [Modestobacter italicus]|uniref:Transcription regulator, TetR family n=1 Tax=Modestobacter italicus (strain DSM 44449 / CECT 9708 / BC 501) TaxID=2732864 RepID=I4F0I3_MODI5|nr:TetR/AcrR family transcriptional regulator [Modestobacter marinus]CCH89146.1 Transcription regulator, TetR family [Modestobacter marinus]